MHSFKFRTLYITLHHRKESVKKFITHALDENEYVCWKRDCGNDEMSTLENSVVSVISAINKRRIKRAFAHRESYCQKSLGPERILRLINEVLTDITIRTFMLF